MSRSPPRRCPCCDGLLDADRITVDLRTSIVSGPLGEVKLLPIEAKIVGILARAKGVMPRDRLAAAAYDHDPDGGPLDADAAICSHMSRARGTRRRPGIKSIGLDIKSVRHHGCYLAVKRSS